MEESLNNLPPAPNQPSYAQKIGEFVWEIVKIVVIALVIIVPVRMYIIQPFIVEGASMEPNFYDGQYLIVDELSYLLGTPKRGEVVIFHPPSDKDVYYIKRVIGLPGERVLIENGSIYIFNNSKPTGTRLNEEEYSLDHKIVKSEKDDLTLKDDEYYLIGDNRTNSLDSRRIGPIKIDFIKGRAWVRALPFDDFSIFKAPNSNF